MLLTLCYAWLTLVQQRHRSRLLRLLHEHVHKGSILFHIHDASSDAHPDFTSQFCQSSEAEHVDLLIEQKDRHAMRLFPKQKVSLLQWTSTLDFKNFKDQQLQICTEGKIHLLVEAWYPDFGQKYPDTLPSQHVNIENHCIPKAWKSSDVLGLLVETTIEDLSILGTAFLSKQIYMKDSMEIRKMITVDTEGYPSNLLDPSSFPVPLSPIWSSTNYARLAEDGGMTLADYSPQGDRLCALTDITPTDVEGDNCYFPGSHDVETLDEDLYGGSNESLAEKVSSLINDNLIQAESSAEETDNISVDSAMSNEAEAASQTSSPLKSIGVQSSSSIHYSSLNTESQGTCGGEGMADEPSSLSEDYDQVLPSLGSSDSTPTTTAPSEILTSDNQSHMSNMDKATSSGLTDYVKLPNVLVFTGEDISKGPCPYFESILNSLQPCLHPDCYIVYLLTPLQVMTDPWSENVSLLVISCENISKDVGKHFETFLINGGKILSCCSNLNFPSVGISLELWFPEKPLVSIKYKNEENVILQHGKHYSNNFEVATALGLSSKGSSIIAAKNEMGGILVLSQVHLEVDPVFLCHEDTTNFTDLMQSNDARLKILKDLLSVELGLKCAFLTIPELTSCYLITKTKESLVSFLSAIKPNLKDGKLRSKDFTLHFVQPNLIEAEPKATSEVLPVLHGFPFLSAKVPFDKDIYFHHLHTQELGQVLFFTEVVTTTMAVIERLTIYNGAVAVAQKQIQGRGRGGNKWISPPGCAMFSAHFCLPLSSQLGQKLPVVQHLVALAIVHGIRKIKGYEELDIRLKWPNDIYYGQCNKIGGVIVNSSLEGTNAHFYIGCGVNVSNSQPTLCINDLVRLHNLQTIFTIEEIIARSLTELENIINQFQANGAAGILSLYYRYWLHSNQRVSLKATKEEVTVCGLNEYGFLLVKTDSGHEMALQPDGNSFDMMKNMISIKS